MDGPGNRTVTLRTGIEAHEGTVAGVTTSLGALMKDAAGALAVYDLVQICRDPAYSAFVGSVSELQRRNLLMPDGRVHQVVKEIVLAGTEGDGLDLRLVNPVTGE